MVRTFMVVKPVRILAGNNPSVRKWEVGLWVKSVSAAGMMKMS